MTEIRSMALRRFAAIMAAAVILTLSAGEALAESAHGGAANQVPPISRVPTCAGTRGQGSASTLCAASLWRPAGNRRHRSPEGTLAEPLARILTLPQHHAGGGAAASSSPGGGSH